MAYTTIKKPSDYFNTVLYTGTGSAQSITGVDFQPDMVWIKDRTGTGYHRINDAVRGATKEIYPNVTNAENTEPQAVTSFDTDGFTVGSNNGYSQNGYNFVSWNWLGANGTTANTDGSITSTVSANTTSGFSIVQYSGNATAGATVGHGLGSVPKMVIVKKTNGAKDWNVYHVGMGATKCVYLNLTNAEQTHGNWNNTTPTNTVFSIGSDDQVNGSGQTYITYCFAEKQGFSKFGSYVGNGNADGTFVYTGFKPKFILTKNSSASSTSWVLTDTSRSTYNVTSNALMADASTAEQAYTYFDITSNGFKARNTSHWVNGSGNTIIYLAFAEEPLVGDNPATAR